METALASLRAKRSSPPRTLKRALYEWPHCGRPPVGRRLFSLRVSNQPRCRAHTVVCASIASEPGDQVELPQPSTAGPVEGSDVVELSDGVSEHVHTQRGSDAAHPVPVATRKGRLEVTGPGHSSIPEERHLDRKGPVVGPSAEEPQQRKAELCTRHRETASDGLFESSTAQVG